MNKAEMLSHLKQEEKDLEQKLDAVRATIAAYTNKAAAPGSERRRRGKSGINLATHRKESFQNLSYRDCIMKVLGGALRTKEFHINNLCSAIFLPLSLQDTRIMDAAKRSISASISANPDLAVSLGGGNSMYENLFMDRN